MFSRKKKNVMEKVLELVHLGSESSDLLLSYVLEVLQELDLLEEVIAILADNTSTQKKNLYCKLQEKKSLDWFWHMLCIMRCRLLWTADLIDLQLIISKIY
jgi:hypothetical protein